MEYTIKELKESGLMYKNEKPYRLSREEFFKELVKNIIRIDKFKDKDAYQEAMYYMWRNLKFDPNDSFNKMVAKSKKYFGLAYRNKNQYYNQLDCIGHTNNQIITYPINEGFSQSETLEYLDTRDNEEYDWEKEDKLCFLESQLGDLESYWEMFKCLANKRGIKNKLRNAYRVRKAL